jgi:hypothetical protein
MKKIFISGLIVVTIMAITSIAIFIGCKKDGDERIVKNEKSASASETMELREYENYCPDESIVYDKLLQIMNCVNEPSAESMPNMEIKEAVWFLEAFFNIGVCSHQKYAMASVIGKKEYLIAIPLEKLDKEQIIIKGKELQIKYRDLLNKIISELCGEYAINFGDMYVSALSKNEVYLGLTALYGHKSKNIFSVQKIAAPWRYPTLKSPTPTLYSCFYGYELPQRDPGMEALLNQDGTIYPISIHKVKKYFKTVTIPVYSENLKDRNDCTKNLFVHTWEKYGTPYRDYIYNNLDFYKELWPTNPLEGYSPLYAFCEVHYGENPNPKYEGEAYHNFGLEYVHLTHAVNLQPKYLSVIQYRFQTIGY